jgi:hypothetical protein
MKQGIIYGREKLKKQEQKDSRDRDGSGKTSYSQYAVCFPGYFCSSNSFNAPFRSRTVAELNK